MEKVYTEFVKRTYGAICELYGLEGSPMLRVFAEGPDNPEYSQSQEYVVLKNKYAVTFFSVIMQNSHFTGIPSTEYKLQKSLLCPDEVKISHSCYPKNMRKWLSGQLSRKKKCRLEFCVLVWCHAVGWSILPDYDEPKLFKCRQKLREICLDYLSEDDINNKDCTFEMLWKASSYTNQQSRI